MPFARGLDEPLAHWIVVNIVYRLNKSADLRDIPVVTAAFLSEVIWPCPLGGRQKA